MKIEAPGELVDFPAVDAGKLFFCFVSGNPIIAMKGTKPDGASAVIAFNQIVHADFPPPTLLDSGQFTNRFVLVVSDASFRTPLDLAMWNDGAPSVNRSGWVMFGTARGTMYARAFGGIAGFIDVNIETGELTLAANDGKYLWTQEWAIVVNAGKPSEMILLAQR